MESASLPRAEEKASPETDQPQDPEALVKTYFCVGRGPYDGIEFGRRDCRVGDAVYSNLEFPVSWEQNTCDIVADKYLAKGDKYSEDSVKQMIDRVARKITEQGIWQGHLDGKRTGPDSYEWGESAEVFYDELRYILINQLAAFNSPVWFNVGRPDRKQQCSACFLLGIEDNTDSIMKWVRDEVFIFKGGSGSGVNLSNLRGSMEPLSTGGTASGPVSFMRPADSFASTFKSGGTTRRAAKLVSLDVDHPDILDFIWCKAREEDRLRRFREIGIKAGLGEPEMERNLAELTAYQNANISVRVTDEFMRAMIADEPFFLRPRKSPGSEEISAASIMDAIATAAWQCADPGMQYHDTINRWHTTPSLGPIRTSNPCNEVHQNDNTSCNLASINVLKFLDGDYGQSFRISDFTHVVDVMSLAMEITCGFSHLPTEELERNTRELRQLGLGYTNMGAAIMAQGLPYDSDEGRYFASSVTALMTGRAYHQSARVARKIGAFKHYQENRSSMLRVIAMHKEAALGLTEKPARAEAKEIANAASEEWCHAKQLGLESGYRNAQATVLAPTGTISFLLGCDTTGIEPAFSLVTHKTLAGGGHMTLVNGSVRRAAQALGGYSEDNLKALAEGDFSCISEEDLPTFATAVGKNDISPLGHLKMLAAVQPFISGAASKTVNLPATATVEDIRNLYIEAWRMGIKAVAIYRDGSKAQQVLETKPVETDHPGLSVHLGGEPLGGDPHPVESIDMETEERAASYRPEAHASSPAANPTPFRRKMPVTRQSITHKFSVAGHEGYINAGMYDDGTLGEIFVSGLGKEGSTLTGVIGAWAIAISMGLQYGVPLEDFVRKYAHMRFDPEGLTQNPEIRKATSIVDYIMRWLAGRFLSAEIHEELGIMTEELRAKKAAELDHPGTMVVPPPAEGESSSWPYSKDLERAVDLGPACSNCGGIMQRTGTCYSCPACGNTTGCG